MKERLFIQDDLLFIVESPDIVTVGPEFGERKQLFTWGNGGDAYPFGYFKGKMVIGQEGRMHSQTIGHDRDRMKFPGRIWTRKKVISFWVYPNLSQLKKVIKDIETTFNNVPLDSYGESDLPDNFEEPSGLPARSRGEVYGKIKIDGNWKLDIPAEGGDSYNDFVKGTSQKNVSPKDFQTRGYLYKLKTVYSGKPLKGAGEQLRKGEDVSTKGTDHVAPAMLKKGAIKKLGKREKESLYNYFKEKGRLSKAEERMYKMIQREDTEIYFDGKGFIFEIHDDLIIEAVLKKLEEKNKKTFTLQEGTGILLEAPHIAVGDKVVDLEFEKDKTAAMKNILKAILKQEITDKYGSKFKLSSDKEVNEFISKVMKNPQVRRMLR